MKIGNLLRPARRIHGDKSGMASVEMILAMPVFLMVMLAFMDIAKYQTNVLHAAIVSRNAAWSKASDSSCFSRPVLPKLMSDVTLFGLNNCELKQELNIGSRFWQGLQEAGNENIFQTVKQVDDPEIVTAKMEFYFTEHHWPNMNFDIYKAEFSMVQRKSWTVEDGALRHGYDNELNSLFRGETNQLMDLFPYVYPGGR